MGWTITNSPMRSYAEEKREILSILTWTSTSYEILQLSKVNTTWYAAVHFKDDDEVFAVIILTCRHDGCWGYKLMTEGYIPHEAKAPMSLIRKLTGPTNVWREKCATYAKRPRPKAGDVIRTKEPVYGATLFRKEDLHHYRGVYRVLDNPNLTYVRLRPDHLVGATLQ